MQVLQQMNDAETNIYLSGGKTCSVHTAIGKQPNYSFTILNLTLLFIC